MNIPIGPFIFLGKTGYNFYSYFFKGPKIDASLKFLEGGHKSLGASHLNPIDRPVFVGEAIHVFNFESRYRLTLKNTSKYPAYNVRLINATDVFSSHDGLEQLTSLNPGESISITCLFFTPSVHAKSNETESHLGIPKNKKGKKLFIAYENEARTTFYTKFTVDETAANNEYSLKEPKE